MERDPVVRMAGTQTLINGLAVVRSVASGARSLKEIRDAIGLPRSTVHRLVSALRLEGFLRDGEAGVVLGSELISLGFAAVAANPLVDVARPVLDELSQVVEDTVHLAIEDGESVLYLAKIPGRRGAEMRSQVGHRMPMTRTGIGKSLLLDEPERWRLQYEKDQSNAATAQRFLAGMDLTAGLGVTVDLEENEPGIRCVAAPVRDPQGAIIAAVSVAATAPYMSCERIATLVPVVAAHASRISTALGGAAGSAIDLAVGPGLEQKVDRLFSLHALEGTA